jgi:Rad3-related DNA helicase
MRKRIGLNIKDAIIIFDEAHNIESVAEDVNSKVLPLTSMEFTKNIMKNNRLSSFI